MRQNRSPAILSQTLPRLRQRSQVRDARTLDPDSVVTIDIANLLDYYPISEPGTYTVQFDLGLSVHKEFMGRSQTQIDDLERTISDVRSRSNYSATEKAGIIEGLKEEIEQLKQNKGNRYIVVGLPGETVNLSSNTLELVIQ